MQPLIMFISSSLCLTAYIFKDKNPKFVVRKNFKWKYLLIPSFLMLINVFQIVIGLRYLHNGLYTIMKSISIISSVGMEKCFYPHRSFTKNQIAGISITVLGQTSLGLYLLFLTTDIMDITNDIQTNVILGITLLLISIFPMAFYYLLQERFMKGFRLDPLQYVGTQGLINTFVTSIFILSFQWLPCGHRACQFEYEQNFYVERVDVWWDQMSHSNIYLYTGIILLMFFAIQMYLEFFIMKAYSGLACNIMSSLYTLVPYIYGVCFAQWFQFNFIQLACLLTILIGVFIFYHIPNFSQFEDSDTVTTTVNIQEDNQIDSQNRRHSSEGQLNPTFATQQQRQSNISDLQRDECQKSGESKSSQKRRLLKQSLIQSERDKKRNNLDNQEDLNSQSIPYLPPNFKNSNNFSNRIEHFNRNQHIQYNDKNHDQRTHLNHLQKRQQNQIERPVINKEQKPNEIQYQDLQKLKQEQQSSKVKLQQNINQTKSKNSHLQYVNNQSNNSNNQNQFPFEDRVNQQEIKQKQQQPLRPLHSQSYYDEEDNTQICQDNKFLNQKNSKFIKKQNQITDKINSEAQFKEILKNNKQNQLNAEQEKDQQQQDYDQSSLISNKNQKISQNSGSGLWINQPNQRNKSHLYDQSLLLIGSNVFENGQSMVFNRDSTPKVKDRKQIKSSNNIYGDNQDKVKHNSSSFIQQDFELNIKERGQTFKQETPNYKRISSPQKDLSISALQQNGSEEIRKKSNLSSKHSLSSKKQKSEKIKLLSSSNFQEDILLDQVNEEKLLQIQRNENLNKQIKRNFSKQQQQLKQNNKDEQVQDQDDSEFLNMNQFQQEQNNIPSPSFSPINNMKKKQKKKNQKLIVLNI